VSALFAWLWIAGAAPAVVLGEVVRAESPRIARTGRIAFALLLGADLLLAAVFFSAGNHGLTVDTTRGIWWVTAILAGVPLALVSGFAVRRGYAGHRLALAAATLTTAALYLAFPLGFVPPTHPLSGLGRFEHAHHALDVLILLVPSLILLADELGRRGAAAPAPEPSDRQHAGVRSALTRERRLAAGGILLLVALIWTAGTNSYGILVALGVLLAGGGVFVWQRNRAEVRSVLRDLAPPEER
jgi:hypothetical protein